MLWHQTDEANAITIQRFFAEAHKVAAKQPTTYSRNQIHKIGIFITDCTANML